MKTRRGECVQRTTCPGPCQLSSLGAELAGGELALTRPPLLCRRVQPIPRIVLVHVSPVHSLNLKGFSCRLW